MPNTPTTPASVASRLTDEEIFSFARFIDGCADDNVCTDKEAKLLSKKAITEFNEFELRYRNIAAVLRDYVRMRKDYAQAIEIARHNYKELKRLLAEAEKGDAR